MAVNEILSWNLDFEGLDLKLSRFSSTVGTSKVVFSGVQSPFHSHFVVMYKMILQMLPVCIPQNYKTLSLVVLGLLQRDAGFPYACCRNIRAGGGV